MRFMHKLLVGASCLGLFIAAFPTRAQADPVDGATFFTFNAPVALPGVSLPAGTYLFKLADRDGDRSVVRVFDRTGRTCYGTFLTIPEMRLTTPDKPSVQFEEGVAHAPTAIAAWFYPGDPTGWEFQYR